MFKRLIGKIARTFLSPATREKLKRVLYPAKPSKPANAGSNDYQFITKDEAPNPSQGWQIPEVAANQQRAFAPLLEQMRNGNVREDFAALARAVSLTGMDDPLIIEIGCGSGWNSEVLSFLWKPMLRYIGMDISPSMTRMGKRNYPGMRFLVGDGVHLPFRDAACDILVSGTVLMHLLDYRKAIEESRRVAGRWCIFHTVPVLQTRETAIFKKNAYGQPTVEVILNEGELRSLLKQNGLEIVHVLDSCQYNLEHFLGEQTLTKTFVCRKGPGVND